MKIQQRARAGGEGARKHRGRHASATCSPPLQKKTRFFERGRAALYLAGYLLDNYTGHTLGGTRVSRVTFPSFPRDAAGEAFEFLRRPGANAPSLAPLILTIFPANAWF